MERKSGKGGGLDKKSAANTLNPKRGAPRTKFAHAPSKKTTVALLRPRLDKTASALNPRDKFHEIEFRNCRLLTECWK